MFRKTILGILISICLVSIQHAQVPQLINYQGVLTDNAGDAITGTRDIQFKIYNAETGGNELWSETQNVAIEDGLFNVLLGSVTPLPLEVFDWTDTYLAIQVEPDNEMSPRQRLASVGYAYQAQNTIFVNYQFLPENDGVVNETEDPVSWYKIKDMPAGFADGTDEEGSGVSGITQIDAGTGISVINPAGPTATLALVMGDGNGIDADMVDGIHAADFAIASHDHWGAFWSNSSLSSSPGLRINGNVPWSYSVIMAENTNTGPGIAAANHSSGHGVYGYNSATGNGVFGYGTSGSGVGAHSVDSYGVLGTSNNSFGAYFSSDNDHYDLALGGSVGRVNTDINDENSELILSSNADATVRLDNDGGEDHVFRVVNSGGSSVFTVDEAGNMAATGTKSATVKTESFGQRLIYCVESPEVWFEDVGKTSLTKGEVEVVFESVFASIVNLDIDYHVFLTPLGQEPVLLFITEKTSSGFKVKGVSLDGDPVQCDFDYRIVAKRLGFEDERLRQPSE